MTHAIYIGGDPNNVDLIFGKVYRVLPPQKLDAQQDVRIVDESMDDYLYPARWFVQVEVPIKVRRALATVG
jgi:hypothetical protein